MTTWLELTLVSKKKKISGNEQSSLETKWPPSEFSFPITVDTEAKNLHQTDGKGSLQE